MNAYYCDYMLNLANASLDELRREAADARLAAAVERSRPLRRRWRRNRRPASPRWLPVPALRRSA